MDFLMEKDKILQLEAANDGQTVYLFYDDMAGLYLAFGLSAYYVTMVTDPFISYSMAMDMPVALLNRFHIKVLRQSLTKVEHVQKSFYVFRMRLKVGDAGYYKWKETLPNDW